MMQAYRDALAMILDQGEDRGDRTGTGTRSMFAVSMQFPFVGRKFPLLTGKETHWHSILTELLWFVDGGTNSNFLEQRGVNIWREWRGQGGEMGPVYGDRWRRWGKPKAIVQPAPQLRDGVEPNFLGIARGGDSSDPLYRRWANMVSRCYDPSDKDYPQYGGRGVFVDDHWLEFEVFCKESKELPGFSVDKQLDKDMNGFGFCYGPEHCQWLTAEQNRALRHAGVIWVFRDPKGGIIETQTLKELADQFNLDPGSLSRVASGKFKSHKGWTFVEKRSDHVDQLNELVNGLRSNPDSRRHLVSAWDPYWSPFAALPPCHYSFQCYVGQGGNLDMLVNQRSADMFLGVPFNIASYATLMHMLANVCDLYPRHLTMNLGDAHIYQNHFKQVEELLRRDWPDYPQLEIITDRRGGYIDTFKAHEFKLIDYNPLGKIKAPVAV